MNGEAMIGKIEELKSVKQELLAEIRKVIVGQDDVVEKVLMGLFANGHMLIESVPGLAKTLLISTIAESQLIAFQLVALGTFLPTFLLSGFVFPISSMPFAIQLVTYVVPARYFLIALRTIVIKGVGIHAYWPQMAALSAYALAVLGVAAVRLARQKG